MKAVLLVSKTFLPEHPKAGAETHFEKRVICGQKINNNRDDVKCKFPLCGICAVRYLSPKIHTCRSSYERWAQKIARLKEVGGVLSVRQWSGKPYRSKQEVIVDIPAEIVGVQQLTLIRKRLSKDGDYLWFAIVDGERKRVAEIAENDGLDFLDFEDWFMPMFDKNNVSALEFAIVHFTNLRYGESAI